MIAIRSPSTAEIDLPDLFFYTLSQQGEADAPVATKIYVTAYKSIIPTANCGAFFFAKMGKKAATHKIKKEERCL
jgi:hypothetical protein